MSSLLGLARTADFWIAAMATLSYADVKVLAKELYDVESRPETVKSLLTKAGVATALEKLGMNGSTDKIMDVVASMSTVQGIKLKKEEVVEIAAPYIEKARAPEGRAELIEEIKSLESVAKGKAMLEEKVVEPVSVKIAAGKELAAPYVASAKEYADPYVAKLAELRKSERVESMMKAFQLDSVSAPVWMGMYSGLGLITTKCSTISVVGLLRASNPFVGRG